MKTIVIFLVSFVSLLSFNVHSKEKNEVNLYSYRQEFLLRPFLKVFEEKTGIKVNVFFTKKGLIERLKSEGKNTPADAVLTVDIGNLSTIANLGLFQTFDSKIISKNIPKKFRHENNLWVGLSARARIIYYSKDRIDLKDLKSYKDLTNKKFKGKICSRSGLHNYNLALLSSMIHHHGEEYSLKWAKTIKENLARKPQGNDRAQVKAISEGLCDLALGNTYYMGKMLENPKQRGWAASTGIFFPDQKGVGTHVNLSGAGITKHAKNKENAIKLIEFLSGDLAQHMYAHVNHEYPLKKGVNLSLIVQSFGKMQDGIDKGSFKQDLTSLPKLGSLREKAIRIMQKAGFN